MEIVLSILKYSLIGLVLIPLILIQQKVLYKEEKQLKWKWILFVYIIMVVLFVLNDIYDIVGLLN